MESYIVEGTTSSIAFDTFQESYIPGLQYKHYIQVLIETHFERRVLCEVHHPGSDKITSVITRAILPEGETFNAMATDVSGVAKVH